LSAIISGDLPLACFVDPILSVQLLDEDTIGVPSEVYDAIPQLMTEALEFHRSDRKHQGLGTQIIRPEFQDNRVPGEITSWRWLGGMLNDYHRHTA
jgi:hypothetical protein